MKTISISRTHLVRLLAALALAFALLGLPTGSARAVAPITVTNAEDSGKGSLRQAIADAGPGNIINFDGNYTILLQKSELTIDKDLTIDGKGHTVTVSGDSDKDGDGDVRVFTVNSGVTFNLSNLIITKGTGTYGGGIFNNDGTVNLSNSTVSASHASSDGGGIYNSFSGTLTITNSTLSGNSAESAGGGFENAGTATITNSTFSTNSAFHGGGLDTYLGNSTITNSTFSANSATSDGGGVRNNSGTVTITNSTFSANSATSYGGGLRNNSGTVTITNSTFSGNSATDGGGIYIYSGTVTLRNTIVASSTGSNCSGLITNGGNNVDDGTTCGWGSASGSLSSTNPLLGTLDDYGGFTQTIKLQAGSSAIDATSSNCPATDQRGQPRSNPTCDIGAYEVQTILLAIPGGQTSGLCESWVNACELSYALASAVSGQEIWAAAGTYKPTTVDPDPRKATFQLIDGVALYGGFAGTETARAQRNPAARVTILSGDLNGNDVGFTNNSENVYHVVTGATGATLDGFTITAGNANAATTLNKYGGGMYNYFSSPALTNVTFSGNSAQYGGGMFNDSSSNPTLTNVTFSGNSAQYGGGMFNYPSSPALTNVTFSGNSAQIDGGGMNNWYSSPTLTNVTFSGNSAQFDGGGMHNLYSSPTIRNTIFWGNTGEQIYNESSTPSVSDSVVQGGCPVGGSTCTNIITTDPVLGTLGNYGGSTQTIPLLPGSSAINALVTGTNGCGTTITADQRGVTRPQGSGCDIGAFESQGFTLPVITFGAAPIPTYLGSNFTVGATTTNTDSTTLTYSYVSGPCAFVSGATFSSTGAGTCVIQADGAATANFYAASSARQSVTVNKADSNVTTWPTATGITYGQTLASSTLSSGSTTPAGSFAFTTPTTAPNAGTASQGVTFTPTDTDNYNTATGTVSVTVNKVGLSVTANADSKAYDGLAYSGGNGVVYSGFVKGETSAVLGGTLAYGGASKGAINVGTYAITPSGLTSGNYTITFNNGTLTINIAAQTITFGALADKTLGDADFSVSAIASSGLTVSFTTTTTSVCTVTAGGTVHLVVTGTCTITAHQGGNGNYNAAPDVSQSFTVDVPVNDAPIITEGTSTDVSMSASTPFSLTLHATDVDGDTITWSISTPAGHGTASASGTGTSKAITYTPALNYIGSDNFVVQVSDGNGGTDTITVNVTITAVEPTSFTIYLPLIVR
jgi:hypothetical protein